MKIQSVQVLLPADMPNVDGWALGSQYSWYQNTGNINVTTDADHSYRVIRATLDTLVYRQGIASYEAKIHFNNLDLLLQRKFYVGTRLSTNLTAGLDAYWINEYYDKTASGFSGTNPSEITTPDSFALYLTTKAWSLGPKFGLDTNWMLGYGISVLANLSASLVYTSYYDLTFTAIVNSITTTSSYPKNLNTLRPVTSMFLGLGWAQGFGEENYHLCLSAGWDFKLLWDYSMIDFMGTRGNTASSNLTLQGLNIKLGLGF